MRICLATTHFAPLPGGISHYYTCLCRLLLDAGHSVILLTITNDEQQESDLITEEGNFIKVVLAKSYYTYRNHYRSFFRPGGYAAYEWIATGMAMRDWLLKHAATYKIDLVETMDYGGAGIFLKEASLPPLVIDAHSSAHQIDRQFPMHHDDHFRVIRELESISFRYADCIIAHSPMNLEELKTMGYEQAVFSRAPWVLPVKNTVEKTPKKNQFLVISSLQMIKGAELMIKAAEIAGNSMDELCICWAGEDSNSAPGGQLTSVYLQKKYPATWGKHFLWIGHKNADEINTLRQESSAIIIPSLWDTFNYVVPETIYAERPLIVSDKTGAVYLINDHPGITRFRSGDPEALADILIHFNEPIHNMKTGQSAGILMDHYFSPEQILTERMMVYRQVMDHRTMPDMKAIQAQLQFLDNYTTRRRRYYYLLRKKIKGFIHPVFNKLRH